MTNPTGPLFKWFGSKWQSGKHLPAPMHDTIIEPFAGGAGYSLRYSERKVLICESDLHIYNLWNWLINEATEALIREIPINVPEGTDIRTLGLSDGQALLLKTWQRTNNVGNCWTISPWGNMPGQFTENTRARVASEYAAVKHWKLQSNGLAVCTNINGTDLPATWLVDPPYQYNYQYSKYNAPINYAELGRLIQNAKGQKIVCEAICSKTGAVPSWLPFKFLGERVTSRRKAENNHHSKELLWVG